MKKTVNYVNRQPYQKGWNGGEVDKTEITLDIFSKDYSSTSCIEIYMKETWLTKEDRLMNRVICHLLPEEKVLELRDILNSLEF